MRSNLFSKLSFRSKITLIACSVSAILFLCYFLFVNISNYYESQQNLLERSELLAEMRAESLSSSMWNFDDSITKDIIKSLQRDKNFFGAEVFDAEGKSFVQVLNGVPDGTQLIISKDIKYFYKGNNQVIGKLVLYISTKEITNALYKKILYSIVAFLVLITAISITLSITFRLVTKPLTQIAEAMEAYGHGKKDVSLPEMNSNDEISTLADNFKNMKSEINDFTNNLEDLVRKRTAQLELALTKVQAANDSKSKFLANFSHELRTPLNAIIGFSEFISGELLGKLGNAKYKEYAKNISDSGTHLLDMINDILDLSKAEAGKLVISMEYIDLADSLHDCSRYIEKKATDANIAVIKNIPANLPPIVIDRIRLKQIMLNLLSNAVKFTPVGGQIVISASVEKLDDINNEFTIIVKDSGIGMSAEQIKTAFETFGQVDDDAERAAKGTGLGLPLTKHLVELMGGTITVESKKDVGTTMAVKFISDNSLPVGEKLIREITLQ